MEIIKTRTELAYAICIYHQDSTVKHNGKLGVIKGKDQLTQRYWLERAMQLLQNYRISPIERALFYQTGSNSSDEVGRYENGVFSGKLFELYQFC